LGEISDLGGGREQDVGKSLLMRRWLVILAKTGARRLRAAQTDARKEAVRCFGRSDECRWYKS
jgi:hypothetical protein